MNLGLWLASAWGLAMLIGCGDPGLGVRTEDLGIDDAAALADAAIGPDLAPPSRSALCSQCVAQRCAADQVDCAADPACRAAAECFATCSTLESCNACGGVLHDRGYALYRCLHDHCYFLCAIDAPLPPAGACVAPGEGCDELYNACCEASVCRTISPSGGPTSCCYPPGAACPGTGCCNGLHGSDCDVSTHTCVERTCANNVCDGTLPCCDPQLTCNDTNEIAGKVCCAVSGSILSQARASLCCTGSATSNGDGTVTCTNKAPGT